MITQLYLEQLLWSAALSEAIAKGYYFGEKCEIVTRDLLQISARKMTRNGTAQDAKAVAVAAANTRRLVREMISVVAKTNTRKRLRERSLLKALKTLCPLWPFC